MLTKNPSSSFPVFCCLFAAALWGLLWYPLRMLEQLGLPGLWATLIIYISALIPLLPWIWKERSGLAQYAGPVFMIGIFAGWTNLAFILAVLDGTVVRVLLLFYLSPIWAVLLGWLVLKERLSRRAWCSVMLALAGAVIMLWSPDIGVPLPWNKADLLAISSGIAFAAANMFVRLTRGIPMILKMAPAWCGVVLISLGGILFVHSPMPELSWTALMLAVAVGCVGIIIMTYCAQYGVTHLPLYRSAVIFMFEVFVGAVSAALLTDEIITPVEWGGGLMIMLAAWITAGDGAGLNNTDVSVSNRTAT